ncbi:MAG: type IV secretion system DNA-binding domain-containing protein [Candidatus Marsarchaeota archaeon]|nr:type IV secretion system DNA-binding domain-containing protein [Candidatus Marsarchaeota archaeon]
MLQKSKKVNLSYSAKQSIPSIISEVHWKNTHGETFIFPELESNSHIIINGMSGFGKSTLVKSMLADIYESDKAAIIFDMHNEHGEIVRKLDGHEYNIGNLGFNLFELNGLTISERVNQLSQLFKDVFSLGYLQTLKLGQCMWYTYRKLGAQSRESRYIKSVPTFYNLLQELEIFINNAKTISEKNSLIHLKERIELINNKVFSKNTGSLSNLKKGISSISLESLNTRELQMIYISELIKRLYSTMHENDKEAGLRLYIVIDESELIIELADAFISKLITEGRKYGIGLIIVMHRLADMNRQIISNVSTFISFFITEPQDLNYVSDLFSGGDPIKRAMIKDKLCSMKVNQAMIMSTKIRSVTIVDTSNIKIVLGKIDKLKAIGSNNNNSIAAMGFDIENNVNSCKISDNTKIYGILKNPVRKKELESFLADYEIKNIDSMPEIDKFTVKDNKGQMEEWLMLHSNSLSIEHEVYVKIISKYLKSNSIRNYIYGRHYGPDIIAHIADRKIAVEYETGRKNIISTKAMIENRIKEFDAVIVIVNQDAFKFYKEFIEGIDKKVKVFCINDINSNVISNILQM